jgi:hypothetical protein
MRVGSPAESAPSTESAVLVPVTVGGEAAAAVAIVGALLVSLLNCRIVIEYPGKV